jgi:hypothetical protein
MWKFLEALVVIILAVTFIGSSTFHLWGNILLGIATIIALVVIFKGK